VGVLSAAVTALAVVAETSRAADAAHAALDRGEALADAVRAFAAETETQLDDAAVEEMIDAAEAAVDWTRQAGVWLVASGPRVEEHGRRLIEGLRLAADSMERELPGLIEALGRAARVAGRAASTADDLLGR
jgi:CHASE3 domain sensor protein